jgi:DNA-binding transcriptional regulator YhcF (GntR family)
MAQSPIDLSLDRASDIPLGTQLAWKLRGAIASGRLAPGDRLPGVRELAAEAGVNVNTVRSVYARLADQGVIVSQHGRGTFVGEVAARDELVRLAERAAQEARESGIDPRELAALLYASPASQDQGRSPFLHGREDSATVRRELRESIERLEREQAELEVELAVAADDPLRLPEPVKPSPARKRIGARLLSTEELEAARDALAGHVAGLRRQLTAARERDAVAGRVPRSVAAGSPQTATGGGSWTLRWKV